MNHYDNFHCLLAVTNPTRLEIRALDIANGNVFAISGFDEYDVESRARMLVYPDGKQMWIGELYLTHQQTYSYSSSTPEKVAWHRAAEALALVLLSGREES